MAGTSGAGRALGTTIKGARLTARGGTRAGRWIGRNVGFMRVKGGGGEVGMIRLLDLHAASCAGDTLVTMGLAGTVFFNVSVGEARGRVALYLLITMVPFTLLAPVVGPLLDRFRHGRRYALAVTMLGRAFLAWLISDNLGGLALYPAAFGILALSRAYGVARSAAVPRLLPPGLGLSEAGARASIFGTVAGAVIAPIGLVAFWFGHPWPLRVAAVVFVVGMVIALRLPPKADSEPPEVVPRIFALPKRNSVKVLSGRLIVALLSGGAVLRAIYGFLTLFLAFSIRSNELTTSLLGIHLSQTKALAIAVGALGVGTFVATAIGARLKIHRPALIQAGGIVAVTITALAAAAGYNLALVVVLCLATAIVSGFAKMAIDATIQEQIPEHVRASAFAHSETLLMLAWVLGGAIGLIPFPGRVGLAIAAAGLVLAAIRSVLLAVRLRKDRLTGQAHSDTPTTELVRPSESDTEYRGGSDDQRRSVPVASPAPGPGTATRVAPAETKVEPGPAARAAAPVSPTVEKPSRWRQMFGGPTPPEPEPQPTPSPTQVMPRGEADQPSYHLYRPTPTTPDNPTNQPPTTPSS